MAVDFDQLMSLFTQATESRAPEEWDAFLDEMCAGDDELRGQLRQLLDSHLHGGSLLDHPAVEGAATQLLADSAGAVDGAATGSRTTPYVEDIPLDFLEPPQKPGSIGRLGQYDILETIGRGGMGIVLKAHDASLNRVAAVKVLAPELASNPTARKRFEREAQAAAAVSHDHVVTIFAVETGGGNNRQPYLVMEFIDGESLQQKIDREGALELTEILRIGRQIAAGLAAAHEQGLIHRDVKPSNILLQNGVQRVQITDFGLARAVDDVGMTCTGEVTGTPQYMSPEQAQGMPVDARSDLFSLGSLLYAMCTGRGPFRADSSVASLRRVCDDTPRPVRETNADTPIWLVEIIDCLLEKDPEKRFQSAAEVSDLLAKCLARLQEVGPSSMTGIVLPHKTKPAKKPTLRTSSRRHTWLVPTMILLTLGVLFSVTEATGVTQVSSTVIRIVTGEGTLVVEVDDPSVEVSIDGEELSITGAGLQEIKLRPGQYQFTATKDGEPIEQRLVSISRGGREVVRVTHESAAPNIPPTVSGHFYSILADGRLMSITVDNSAIQTEEVANLGSPFSDENNVAEGLAMGPDHMLYVVVSMEMVPDPEWAARGRPAMRMQSAPSRLYRVDPRSATTTLLGEMDYKQVDGLSFNAAGDLFGVVSVLGGGEATPLLKFIPETAQAQPVGAPLNFPDIDALAIDAQDRAFTASSALLSQTLIELDLNGSQSPFRHQFRPDARALTDIEGMTFGQDGILYAITQSESHRGLYRISIEPPGMHQIGPLPFISLNLAADTAAHLRERQIRTSVESFDSAAH